MMNDERKTQQTFDGMDRPSLKWGGPKAIQAWCEKVGKFFFYRLSWIEVGDAVGDGEVGHGHLAFCDVRAHVAEHKDFHMARFPQFHLCRILSPRPFYRKCCASGWSAKLAFGTAGNGGEAVIGKKEFVAEKSVLVEYEERFVVEGIGCSSSLLDCAARCLRQSRRIESEAQKLQVLIGCDNALCLGL